ncbi:hypothetical protein EYZ11_011821 [Aspergillus tanneri]|uniref:Uncharacterized protein n=1 Tax=Aspergillus tanneri TaxID=1220188 RepID=A0A4S3J1T5_9EURO|nr:hypothetical protein EYZ11_011821 [Aspergillus tanneri]
MTYACAAYGRQIFGVGGRLAWADDQDAGCYEVPAFLYDAQSEAIMPDFDKSLSEDIKNSLSPKAWADPALKRLFVPRTNSKESVCHVFIPACECDIYE